MANVTELSEQKQTAASYVLQFFNQITLVTHHYAVYLNLLAELEAKYGARMDTKDMAEEERLAIVEQLQNFRYHSHIAFIQFRTIVLSAGKDFDTTKVNESYKLVRDTFVITRDQAGNFLEALNEFLASTIMKELLKTSQDIVSSVYQN